MYIFGDGIKTTFRYNKINIALVYKNYNIPITEISKGKESRMAL